MPANRLKEYFVFTKKERIGIISLLVIIVAVWYLPDFWAKKKFTDKDEVILLNEIRNQIIEEQEIPGTTAQTNHSVATVRLFSFDPNTLPKEEWLLLGISEKTASTIENYRNKGGQFKAPEDLQKIYGLKPVDFQRLKPYINIAQQNFTHEVAKVELPENKPAPKSTNTIIDINQSDSVGFKSLRGIGSVLSKRIVAFRDKLGGFYSSDQLAEVYGLPDSTYRLIRGSLHCNANDIKRIDINSVTIDELKSHPYIKYQLAAAVITYRNQHGYFNSLEELKKIHLLTDEIFERIEPYLIVTEKKIAN